MKFYEMKERNLAGWRRWVSLLLVICLVLSVSPTVRAGSSSGTDNLPAIEVSSTEGKPGDTVSMAVFSEPEDLIYKFDFSLEYDASSLELLSVDDELHVSSTETYTIDSSTTGSIHFNALLSNTVILEKTKIATLNFRIKESVLPGDLMVNVTNYVGNDPSDSIYISNGSITVTAAKYSVAFDSQGGSLVASVIDVNSGATISEPPAPIRKGYSFMGWYTDPEGTSAWDFSSAGVKANTTLYAKWQRHTVTIGIGSIAGAPGETVNVSVRAVSEISGVGSYVLRIDFDAGALEVTDIQGAAGDYFDSNYNNTLGWLKTVWVDSDGGDTPIMAGDELFTVSFLIKSEATNGQKALTVQTSDLNQFSVTDDSANEMEKTLNPGKVTVSSSSGNFDVPAVPQGLTAVGGDSQAYLEWTTVTEATYYNIYMSTEPEGYSEQEIASVAASVYTVKNLSNGQAYYFTVKAGNAHGLSEASVQQSATPSAGGGSGPDTPTPATVPGVPTNVTAIAGNGQATVRFTAPASDGGSSITGYEVTAEPGGVVVTGTASPIVVTGLTNGTSYTFTVKAVNTIGASAASVVSNAVDPYSSSTSGGTGTPVTTTPSQVAGVEILVNGKAEQAGTVVTSDRSGQKVITIQIDPQKLEQRLAAEGQGAVITIPVSTSSDVIIGELNGQMVKNMESKQAVVELRTPQATYTLPASQIQIDAITEKMGRSVALKDIKIYIEIAATTASMLKVLEDTAAKGSFTFEVPPIEFTVKAVNGDTTVEVSKFNAYVQRSIVIPAGVDPNKITTGVVVAPDGSVRHVPTKIVNDGGTYYAQINSLTNSTYSVVWHPVEFDDVASHWSQSAVNDLGSRMIIEGTGDGQFSPNRDITRAEFAAILVRGLGLAFEQGEAAFSDVKQTDWYSKAVSTAQAYELIGGYEDGTFRPNDKITREQAMVMLAKAMKLTGLKDKQSSVNTSTTAVLGSFKDATAVSTWAQDGVADSVQAGIVSGRGSAELAPKQHMTRAEVAAMVQRLLRQSGLI